MLIETSDDITALAKALPKAQAAFGKVGKDAANPHFNSRYASLVEITDATLPALNAAGITVLQPVAVGETGVEVTTILMHESGQWLRATHTVPISRRDAQGVGSALTYARRQALQALLTVAAAGEDDDGEGAVGRGAAASRPPLPPAPPPEKPPMHDRVERLEQTMAGVKTDTDLDRAWGLAKGLRDEIDAAGLVSLGDRLVAAYQARRAELLHEAAPR